MTTAAKKHRSPLEFSVLRVYGIFSISLFLLIMLLSAFVIMPKINQLLESQHNKDIQAELALEAALFARFIESQQIIVENLAAYPSLTSAVMLSDASDRATHQLLDNASIGGKKSRLVLQDIAGNILIKTDNQLQANYTGEPLWLTQVINSIIPYHFQLLSQEGPLLTFKISVPIIYNGHVEGILSSEITTSLQDIFVSQSFNKSVAFKLVQGPITVSTGTDSIELIRENSLLLQVPNITFTYITDDIIINKSKRSLQNSILLVLLVSFSLSFLLLAVIGYRSLLRRNKIKKHQTFTWRTYTFPVVVGIIGISASIAAFMISSNIKNAVIEKELIFDSKQKIKALRKNINANLQVIDFVKALYGASDNVSRQDFSTFVTPALLRYKSIQAVEWVPFVPHEQRDAYKKEAIADGLSHFTIKEKSSNGELITATERDSYFPVYYVVPLKGNEHAIGFDLASDLKRLAALNNAIAYGDKVATARINLVQNSVTQAGILIFTPVYEENSVTNNLKQQQKLLGFAVLVLRISELIEELSIEESNQVLMHIEDISEPDHVETIYGIKQESQSLSRVEVITVANRNWRITTYNDTKESPSILSQWLVLISGLVLSGVITLGIYSLIRRREVVENQVSKRTYELQASEEQHRAVVENAVDGLLTIDEVGTIEKFNQAAQKIFGYSPEEVIGVNIKILMPEPYHGEHDGYLKSYRDTGVKKIIGIGRYVEGKRKDGTIFPIELSVSEMNFGSIKKFSGIIRDVSERVALEKERDSFTEKLIESEEQHRAVVENAVDGLLTINEVGTIEKFNQAAQKIFGYSPEEVIGVNIKILMPEPYHGEHDGYLKSYRDTGVKKIIGIGRYVEGKRKDGTIFPIELSVSEMYFGSTRKFSGIIRDVSARVEQEKEREKLIDKLTDSNEELERFAFVCSHDLQEPLRMVRSFSEKLQDHIAESLEHDVKGKKYFHFVIDGAARAQTLITDILTYSSISTDTQLLESVNIVEIVTIIKSNMLDTAENTKGRITFDSLPTLQGNKTQLFQLFQNLINNGLKYQKPNVEPHVHVSVEDSDQHWTFSIKDNGIGMEERHLKKIFEVFQRLHRRSQYAGTGVGLSICKKVTERHGGSIWVESEKGIGSTFYVKLLKPTIIEDIS